MLTISVCLHLLVLLALLGAGDSREVPGTLHLHHHEAVPVIHLTEEQYSGKASVDDYLKMFPNELLASNKRVKPIDVRKIEHDDYIDYEIEFIELPAHDGDEAETEDFILKTESSKSSNSDSSDNRIQNGSPNTKNTARKSEKSKELNLVNFNDLVRKTKVKTKPGRPRQGDRRRRRRIKLKRDPVRFPVLLQREINEASNQINTEQSKQDQNNFGETHVFTKPRTIIRNLIQLPETVRKPSSVLDRRTNVPRVSHFRTRKRIPLKSGRSFYRDDKPSEQLIRLRNSEIIAKLERSSFKERHVMRTKGRKDVKSVQTGDGRVAGVPSPPPVVLRTPGPGQITTTRSLSIQTTGAPLMMYPEVFTTRPQDVPVTEVPPITAPPAHISLLSVFRTDAEKVDQSEVLTTVSSALKFSIVSTSTQTSVPVMETTTFAVDTPPVTQQSESVTSSTSSSPTTTTTTTTSTTTTTTTTTQGTWTERELDSTTATSEDSVRISVTEMTDSDVSPTTTTTTTTTQAQEDESKFSEVTTVGEPRSIRHDNPVTTATVPTDLELSESITSVYLHNSSVKQSVKKDIKTSEKLNKETVNSIKMLPYSKPVDEVQSSQSSAGGSRSPVTERVFTVTPVYYTSSVQPPQDGQYHETNPGPYQHDDIGDTAEPYVHDERANYKHDPTGDTAPPYQHDRAGEVYNNINTNYPGDYEVNEVKVDFDNQDEHKIYNVQAKAGDFIIGEVGRIDINNGQTVEGVRYTALQGEVDPTRIAEILNRFFGARTASR